MKKKVAIAMSGGVDSGVAAGLLVKQGYKCSGFHLRLWHDPTSPRQELGLRGAQENKCCSPESEEAARQTAYKLGMNFYLVNVEELFKKKVVDYFLQAYAAGQTPNPCVMCNKFIKFGYLLDYVRGLGFDYLATGHYARISLDSSDAPPRAGQGGRLNASEAMTPPRCLLMAKDKQKDQTYFLYNLTQKQLAHILFPVGDYTKKQVRQIARQRQLPVAERPESQEICFLPENDYRPFLRRQIPNKIKPGEVINIQGKVIGRHHGLALYTIGQRHGFTAAGIGPFYVINKDIKKNRLIVGFGQETERKEFEIRQVNWINSKLEYRISNLSVRIRHQGELLRCKLKVSSDGDPDSIGDSSRRRHSLLAVAKPRYGEARWRRTAEVTVMLAEPTRGIAPGQAAVFYRKEEVLGGGIITY